MQPKHFNNGSHVSRLPRDVKRRSHQILLLYVNPHKRQVKRLRSLSSEKSETTFRQLDRTSTWLTMGGRFQGEPSARGRRRMVREGVELIRWAWSMYVMMLARDDYLSVVDWLDSFVSGLATIVRASAASNIGLQCRQSRTASAKAPRGMDSCCLH